MSWQWLNLLRRARVRGLAEGKVQTGRTEALENDARDKVERWQDYGFSGHPVDGEGLVINAGGHTIMLRVDRLGDRPQLDRYEVSVWHKDGHRITLKAGRLVQVDCDELVINAASSVQINSPTVQASGELLAVQIAAGTSLQVAGSELHGHTHGGILRGVAHTDPLV
jgi:phage gp45-like